MKEVLLEASLNRLYDAHDAYVRDRLPDGLPNPLYMGFRKISSNKSQGGIQIPLPYKSHAQEGILSSWIDSASILDAHGHGIELPEDVASLARRSAMAYGRKHLQYCAVDIARSTDGRVVLYEVQRDMGVSAFETLFFSRRLDNSKEDPTELRLFAGRTFAQAMMR
jgi:hypothetical protein